MLIVVQRLMRRLRSATALAPWRRIIPLGKARLLPCVDLGLGPRDPVFAELNVPRKFSLSFEPADVDSTKRYASGDEVFLGQETHTSYSD
jgi:hypothetical protein